jgi:hypothetical protein
MRSPRPHGITVRDKRESYDSRFPPDALDNTLVPCKVRDELGPTRYALRLGEIDVLGIAPQQRPDHAGYIAHWVGVMKADKRAIFTAAAKASEAANFLRDMDEGA